MVSTVRAVVRDVVTEAAPHEIPLLDGLAPLDDERVTMLLARRRGRREPLGFGASEVVALVTPVVWLVVDEAARRVTGAALTGTATRAKSVARRLLRRPPKPPQTVPPLTSAQLEAVHRSMLEYAARAGIEPSRAELLADTVVSRLARESADAPERTGEAAD